MNSYLPNALHVVLQIRGEIQIKKLHVIHVQCVNSDTSTDDTNFRQMLGSQGRSSEVLYCSNVYCCTGPYPKDTSLLRLNAERLTKEQSLPISFITSETKESVGLT